MPEFIVSPLINWERPRTMVGIKSGEEISMKTDPRLKISGTNYFHFWWLSLDHLLTLFPPHSSSHITGVNCFQSNWIFHMLQIELSLPHLIKFVQCNFHHVSIMTCPKAFTTVMIITDLLYQMWSLSPHVSKTLHFSYGTAHTLSYIRTMTSSPGLSSPHILVSSLEPKSTFTCFYIVYKAQVSHRLTINIFNWIKLRDDLE